MTTPAVWSATSPSSFRKASGGQVVKAEFPEGNSDFTSYIANAKKEGCGVFYAPISIEAAQLVINQAASQNLGMPILAGDTWDSNVILEAAKGTDVKIDVTTFYAGRRPTRNLKRASRNGSTPTPPT